MRRTVLPDMRVHVSEKRMQRVSLYFMLESLHLLICSATISAFLFETGCVPKS